MNANRVQHGDLYFILWQWHKGPASLALANQGEAGYIFGILTRLSQLKLALGSTTAWTLID